MYLAVFLCLFFSPILSFFDYYYYQLLYVGMLRMRKSIDPDPSPRERVLQCAHAGSHGSWGNPRVFPRVDNFGIISRNFLYFCLPLRARTA